MLNAGAVRVVAMGILVAVLTACGGGGSGGGSGGGLTPRPDVSLPDLSTAAQKSLTPDNAKQALILALRAIKFVEAGIVPVPAAVDLYADSFEGSPGSTKLSTIKHAGRQISTKIYDESEQFCVSGSAKLEDTDEPWLGKLVWHYRSCDTGSGVLDGDVDIDVRESLDAVRYKDASYTFRGLRITDASSDVVFDGTILLKTEYPGSGYAEADVDMRDLNSLQGARLVDYRVDFNIASGVENHVCCYYSVKQVVGRIYDADSEYFELSLTPGNEPWPMLIGKDSNLTMSPSNTPAPFQVHIALNIEGDPSLKYTLLTALDSLYASNSSNANDPVFQSAPADVRLNKSESVEVSFGDVTDADQQFVHIDWDLAEKPYGSQPSLDVRKNGFVFSSPEPGDYRVVVTATDGERTVKRDINIRVMYDMPQLNAYVPISMEYGESISFQVDIANPAEGDIAVTPILFPGMRYESGAVNFSPQIPNFGVAQEVNLSFVVANEDHQQIVSYPITVQPKPDADGPINLFAFNSLQSLSGGYLFGHFTSVSANEVAELRGDVLHLYEIEEAGKRYRESFPVGETLSSGGVVMLGVIDSNGDGFDEILFATLNGADYYTSLFDLQKRKFIQRQRVSDTYYSFKMGSAAISDLDGDGYKDIALVTPTGIYLIDTTLDIYWQSVGSAYGSYVVAANVDGDPAMEVVTDTGFVLDGKTRETQHESSYEAVGSSFFAADVDGDGLSEFFLVRENELMQMTAAGYVQRIIGPGFNSNVVVRNVDVDPADEIVFVTSYDSGSSTEPYPPSWMPSMATLAYVDVDSGNFSVSFMRQLQYGSNFFFTLNYLDIDGDQKDEYLGQIHETGYSDVGSFIYRQEADAQLPFEFFGVRPFGGFEGAAAISGDGNQLMFCGEIGDTPDLSSRDLFTFNLAEMRLDNNLSRFPNSAEDISVYDLACFTSHFDANEKNYVVTYRQVAFDQGGSVHAQNEALVQDVITGEVVFSGSESNVPVVLAANVGDVDGDGVDGDLVEATSETVRADNMFSKNLIAKFDIGDEESIYRMQVGDVFPGNSGAEIVLSTSMRVLVLAYDGSSEFKVVAELKNTSFNNDLDQIVVVDANAGGQDEIVFFEQSARKVHVLDGELKAIEEWGVDGYIEDVDIYSMSNGQNLLVTLESEEELNGSSRVVWRDPLSGTVVSRSADDLPTRYDELSLLLDNSKLSGVTLTSVIRATISQ